MFIDGIRKGPWDKETYVNDIPAIAGLTELWLTAPVTIFLGENGSGKSTLLEAIAVSYGFNPEGGSKNFSFATQDTHSGLHEALTLIKGPIRPKDGYYLRAESFYNMASYLDKVGDQSFFMGYGGKSLHQQSHGESFMALAMNRFRGKGLYLLDEPEAALSPSRQLALLRRMYDLVVGGAQFILATHSPILMAYPGAELFLLDEQGLKKTAYEQTEHVAITRSFMANPQRMLTILLADE